jgi:hypothetical protein
MTVAEHAANTARAFLAAEIAMTSVNCGAPIVNRTRAEKLLDLYFALVEQAVPCKLSADFGLKANEVACPNPAEGEIRALTSGQV